MPKSPLYIVYQKHYIIKPISFPCFCPYQNMKQPQNVDIPSKRTVYCIMEKIGISYFIPDAN